jgi:hypothetical protein
MDGKGRYLDNIFVERLWRTVKYEEVYLKAYTDGGAGQGRSGRLLSVLQYPKAPPGPGVPDTGRGVLLRRGGINRTADREEVVTKRSIGRPWQGGGTLT